MSDPLYDAEYWYSRAEGARMVADMSRNPETKRIMVEIVASYQRLAELAKERAKKANPKTRP
jgi:hypothetical protein